MYRQYHFENMAAAKAVTSLEDINTDNVAYLVSGEDSYTSESFGKALVSLMGKRHITVEQLAEQTHLSPKTIQRMRTKADFRFDHKTVVALCVGLHLDAYDSRKMLELAGLVLTGNRRDRVYQVILNFAFKETVDSCNELLQRLEMEPLTENKAE